jgi:hypothetical protein
MTIGVLSVSASAGTSEFEGVSVDGLHPARNKSANTNKGYLMAADLWAKRSRITQSKESSGSPLLNSPDDREEVDCSWSNYVFVPMVEEERSSTFGANNPDIRCHATSNQIISSHEGISDGQRSCDNPFRLDPSRTRKREGTTGQRPNV